jgi:hypothetical protein
MGNMALPPWNILDTFADLLSKTKLGHMIMSILMPFLWTSIYMIPRPKARKYANQHRGLV